MTEPLIGRLELKYEVTKMSTLYEVGAAPWDDAEFTAGTDFTGTLRLWEEGVEPEQVWDAKRRLEDRAESLRVAFRYLGNHNIAFKPQGYPTYYHNDRGHDVRSESEWVIITEYLKGLRETYNVSHIVMPMPTVHITMSSSPAPLPKGMPLIPSDLQGLAETIVAADELSRYPDLVMKLAFLIIEELDGEQVLNRDELLGYLNIRDFVSHITCDRTRVSGYIGQNFPAAKVSDKEVRFNRKDPDHISFVAKYAYPALQRAKELFTEKVEAEGGYLR